MHLQFPAMRGQMGSRTYYACLVPMNAIPKLFKFTNWAGISPEDREQRILNTKRIPDLKSYILENEDEYLFSAITASYKSEPTFVPSNGNGNDSIGTLNLKLSDELIINDGQHRCAGIAAALDDNPNFGENTIAVLLFPYENKERVQQMFSDLNRFVQKTSKSLDILYDKRDPVGIATLEFINTSPIYRKLTEKDRMSLEVKSTKLFTLAALYDANKELLKGADLDPEEIEENTALFVKFWTQVAKNMPEWNSVFTEHKLALEFRAENLSTHSTVLRALGALGAELGADQWEDRLPVLQSINWSKKNVEWENVCVIANSVVSNRQARVATRAFLKAKLGLPMSDAEAKSLSGTVNGKELVDKAQADLKAI